MKKFKLFTLCLLMAASAFTFQSCDDDNESFNTYFPNAVVTLKTNPVTGAFYMQLDDNTTLVPSNIKTAPYDGKELRALVNFRLDGDDDEHSAKSAYINWIDTIRTKPMVLPLEDINESYGDDPIELINDWMTVVEDGYFTIRFRTLFGNGKPHTLNLVKGDNPYEVILCHDADGDVHGYPADGMMAFRLDKLPDTEGKTVMLTVKWNSFSGAKSAQFKYRTRE